ncbi:MAG: YraN family protein [Patescibacteria group bacterium]|nr:YraN family protein [Patescibacteria group bacterium]
MNSSLLGRYAEKIAANYLVAQGYLILEANYMNKSGYRIGEIDLIAKDRKGWYIFVEVKARKGDPNSVVPEENITASKIRKIIKTANNYLLNEHRLGCPWRIDAISIILDFKTRKAQVRHLKHIRF